MSGRKALFVAKDLGSVGVILPLAKLWRDAQGDSIVIVEGLAGAKFLDESFKPFFQGTENFQVVPFTLDVDAAFKAAKPEVVVACGSVPINLERLVAQAADTAGIPLVAVDDIWGGYKRLEANPSLILTFDSFGQKMAGRFPSKVVGNPGIPSSEKLAELQEKGWQIRPTLSSASEPVIAYVSGDRGSTVEEITLLLSCLELTPQPWKLVTAFHPKWLKIYGTEWKKMLETVNGVVYTDELGINSEQLVSAADLVVAGVSTVMTAAAALGKPVLSLATPEVMKILIETANLPEVPQVSLGWAQKTTTPINLFEVKPPSEGSLSQLRSYDPKAAYQEILSFMGW